MKIEIVHTPESLAREQDREKRRAAWLALTDEQRAERVAELQKLPRLEAIQAFRIETEMPLSVAVDLFRKEVR